MTILRISSNISVRIRSVGGERMDKLLKWHWTKETNLTFALGISMILLSLAMVPFNGKGIINQIMSFLIRDVAMIWGLGICFVTTYCKKNNIWQDLGISKKKFKMSMILNVILAIMLLGMFLAEGYPSGLLRIENFFAASYILVAGMFEMLFIYGFLRMGFEKSFGIVPAVLFTAVFYSFHHAGFQPEFFHLFWVGIMYVSVFYITHSLWIIFPFFWGVGALWDVIVDSAAGEGIKNPFSFGVALIILVASIVWIKCLYSKNQSLGMIKEENN